MGTRAIVLSIASIADPIIDAYEAGHEIFKKAASAMESVEREGKIKEGDSKKKWVMAYVESIVRDMKAEWPTWKTLLSDFIDKMIKIYNAITKLIK